MSDRLSVRKTYKLWIGGAFVRSESGRYDEAHGFNVPRGSRKDVRDAVLAAKNAWEKWAGRTAFNRGQILYRAAEMLEERHAEFVDVLDVKYIRMKLLRIVQWKINSCNNN